MKNVLNTTSGFTIIEVMVSVGIMLVFLPFAASMLTNSQMLASYAKHKTQAAFAAQQIVETERQAAFIPLIAGGSKIIGPNSVFLDTKGNYVNPNCNTNSFCGTSIITVTPAVYTKQDGTKTTKTNVDHFVVQIYWSERIFKLMVPMTETYAADIVNDPMLN